METWKEAGRKYGILVFNKVTSVAVSKYQIRLLLFTWSRFKNNRPEYRFLFYYFQLCVKVFNFVCVFKSFQVEEEVWRKTQKRTGLYVSPLVLDLSLTVIISYE